MLTRAILLLGVRAKSFDLLERRNDAADFTLARLVARPRLVSEELLPRKALVPVFEPERHYVRPKLDKVLEERAIVPCSAGASNLRGSK